MNKLKLTLIYLVILCLSTLACSCRFAAFERDEETTVNITLTNPMTGEAVSGVLIEVFGATSSSQPSYHWVDETVSDESGEFSVTFRPQTNKEYKVSISNYDPEGIVGGQRFIACDVLKEVEKGATQLIAFEVIPAARISLSVLPDPEKEPATSFKLTIEKDLECREFAFEEYIIRDNGFNGGGNYQRFISGEVNFEWEVVRNGVREVFEDEVNVPAGFELDYFIKY
ncbi:MAG: hypothetical protein AAFY71_00035 [Bacteroidota bacterium]